MLGYSRPFRGLHSCEGYIRNMNAQGCAVLISVEVLWAVKVLKSLSVFSFFDRWNTVLSAKGARHGS